MRAMATSDPRALRALAHAHRRGADRLVMLRLRMARGFADADARSPRDDEHPAPLLALQEEWTARGYPAIGRLSTLLRARSRELDAAALRAERTQGARMGGYAGAGYLGSGDRAAAHLREVTELLGGMTAARERMRTGPPRAILPGAGASHAIGAAAPTPDHPAEH